MNDSARHAAVKRLFGEALARDASERDAWLEAECGGDAGLLGEVRALLAADAEDFVPPCPDRIGEFRIVRRIGEGGMGTVYEAEQESPRRRVALKVMGPFAIDEEAARRFRYETEILGQLDHPGIAKIHAAGVDNGRPWFAMELVDGVPLDRFVAQGGLKPRERLALLQRVCEAVQHAHNRGVIHRDLKPANILVDAAGQPKLLDFGVAKLVDGEARMTTLATVAGQILGTLAYMSPEQLAADPSAIDPRTDVYALGVLGYELLTGRPLHDLSGKSLAECLVRVRDTQAPRLGTVNTRWRGDVETIVAKALAREKERRYDSAGDLGADIARYLRDEPIYARPPSASYQLRKFVRRHRALVLSLAAVFVALVAGTIVATSFYFEAEAERKRFLAERDEARRQKDRADTEAARAKAERETAVLKATTANEALDFMADLFRAEDPFRAKGGATSTEEVLERASTRIRERLETEPELQTELARTLGKIYESIGDNRRAVEHYEIALQAARRVPGIQDRAIVLALDHLGGTLVSERDFDRAGPVLREFMERARAGQGPDGALAAAMQKTANYLAARNRPEQAEALYREVIAKEDTEFAGQLQLVILSRTGLAGILRRRGKFDEALAILNEGLADAEEAWGDDSSQRLNLLTSIASVLGSARREEEALVIHRRIEREILPRLDADQLRALSLRLDHAQCLSSLRRHQEAVVILDDTLKRARKSLGESHPNLLVVLAAYIEARVKAQRVEGIEPLARELVARQRQRAEAQAGWRLGGYLVTLGNVLVVAGRPAEAIPHYLESLAIVRKSPGIATVPGAHAIIHTVRAYLAAEAFAEGRELAEESLALQRRVFGERSVNYALGAFHLGIILWQTGEPKRAEELLRQAHGLLETFGPVSAQMMEVLKGLDAIAAAQGRTEEALALARRRLAIAEKECKPDDPRLAAARERVARLSSG